MTGSYPVSLSYSFEQAGDLAEPDSCMP